MRTGNFIQTVSLAFSGLAFFNILSLPTASAEEEGQPNFVVILTDDQGYGDLGHHGNLYLDTPVLDELAGESAQFMHFHVHPACAPTRASFLTGRHFLKTGVWGVHGGRDYMHPRETSVADVLQANGYHTGMYGKWHSGKQLAWMPWSRGFDEAWVANLYDYHDNTMVFGQSGVLEKPYEEKKVSLSPSAYTAGKPVNKPGWTTESLTDLAIDFMEEHHTDSDPFFLYLAHLAPHGGWKAPEEYVEKYRNKGLSGSLSTLYGLLEHTDENIGRLLGAMERMGIDRNTVVIFLSDNGPIENSGRRDLPSLTPAEWADRNPQGLRGRKGSVWENGTRVPCFVRWPGKIDPQIIEQVCHVEDLFPTLLEFAGIPIPEDNLPLDGKSLKPLLEGDEKEWEDRTLFDAAPAPYWRTMNRKYEHLAAKPRLKPQDQFLIARNQDFKLVQTRGRENERLLFHIAEDPREMNNVADQYPEVFQQLSTEMESWYEKILDLDHSYRMPVFRIGQPGDHTTYLYACAASEVKGNVKGGSHFTSNWRAAGDGQSLRVKVWEKSRYRFILKAKPGKAPAMVSLCVAGKQRSKKVSGERTVDFGSFYLPEGKTSLSVFIKESGGKADQPVFQHVKGLVVEKLQ